MCANAILCCSDSFNTGVILPYTVLVIVLLLFFICCTYTYTAWVWPRYVNFTDAGQTPNDSTEAEAQKLRTLTTADFGGREAPNPSSQTNSAVTEVSWIDGESPNVQLEDGDGYSNFLIKMLMKSSLWMTLMSQDGSCEESDYPYLLHITWSSTNLEPAEVEGIIAQLERHPPVTFKKTGSYHMTMGLKKLDLDDWLALDNDYLKFHSVRKEMLDDPASNDEVIQCIDSNTANSACLEVLMKVSSYLAKKHPNIFRIYHQGNKKFISNRLAQECHLISVPLDNMDSMNPLEIAARLTMEDLNILKKGE